MVFSEKFSFTSSFYWLKMQKTTFLKINDFGVKCAIKSKYRRMQTGLAILNKHQKFDLFQTIDFLHNFQKSQFSEIFENPQ